MDRWVDFTYREFYDVPRSVIVELPDGLVLLESRFLDDVGEYAESYEAFFLPADVDLDGSWTHLSGLAIRALGSMPIERVEFDESRKKSINLASLKPVLPTP